MGWCYIFSVSDHEQHCVCTPKSKSMKKGPIFILLIAMKIRTNHLLKISIWNEISSGYWKVQSKTVNNEHVCFRWKNHWAFNIYQQNNQMNSIAGRGGKWDWDPKISMLLTTEWKQLFAKYCSHCSVIVRS